MLGTWAARSADFDVVARLTSSKIEPSVVEKHPAHQRIAVGVKAGRGQTEQHVAGHDGLAVDERSLVDYAHAEAG